LMLGMFLGLYMDLTQSHQYLALHTTMLLPGFVVLAIYGALYRLWPAMKETALAKAQFWFAILATFGEVVGSYQFVKTGSTEPTLLMLSSVLALFGGLMMVWLFWTKSAESAWHVPASKSA
jgi:hypothetical protein